jgi:hypothetical protein
MASSFDATPTSRSLLIDEHDAFVEKRTTLGVLDGSV